MRREITPLVLAAALVGCTNHPMESVPSSRLQQSNHYFPQTLEKDIDVLFVIDNSGSMDGEQTNLRENFPRLIESLRTHKLGPDGSGKPCRADDTSGCKIPNVRIGVVSTDLGAGSLPEQGCSANGDGGRLQSQPRDNCVGPSAPFIEYTDGVTNVQNPAAKDPIEQVKQAFSCIAKLGTDGCGYEHTLEAARRALDGKVNPGFLRPEALLAVVFITDEDDCSASNQQLFSLPVDTQHASFRCFKYGVRCSLDDYKNPGPRKDCQPVDGDSAWLHPVSTYVDFFKKLKPHGRVILSALAGPTDIVNIHSDAGGVFLGPSCHSFGNKAAPALRLKSVVDAFGQQGHFSKICTDDFGPALRQLGELIIASLSGQCIGAPPLTSIGHVACNAGDALGKDSAGRAVTCQAGCLEKADCVVELKRLDGSKTFLPRCEPAKFKNPGDRSCGAVCPCWRLVPKPAECNPAAAGSPYALEVLRNGEPQKGSVAVARCATTPETWGSAPFSEMPQCN